MRTWKHGNIPDVRVEQPQFVTGLLTMQMPENITYHGENMTLYGENGTLGTATRPIWPTLEKAPPSPTVPNLAGGGKE